METCRPSSYRVSVSDDGELEVGTRQKMKPRSQKKKTIKTERRQEESSNSNFLFLQRAVSPACGGARPRPNKVCLISHRVSPQLINQSGSCYDTGTGSVKLFCYR